MIDEAHPDTVLAHAMRALGHPVRLSILRILAEKCDPQCCCTEVTQCLPLAQSTVSQHIKVLFEAGLVKRDARGTRNCYSIDFTRLDALQAAYDSYMSGLRPKRGTPVTASIPESV